MLQLDPAAAAAIRASLIAGDQQAFAARQQQQQQQQRGMGSSSSVPSLPEVRSPAQQAPLSPLQTPGGAQQSFFAPDEPATGTGNGSGGVGGFDGPEMPSWDASEGGLQSSPPPPPPEKQVGRGVVPQSMLPVFKLPSVEVALQRRAQIEARRRVRCDV